MRLWLLLATAVSATTKGADRPNIIVMLADDMGYNDFGVNNKDMITPHLDALFKESVFLDQNYVQPMCTPTRSAFLTGLYPYRYGRSGLPLSINSPTGLTTEKVLLPQRLKRLGYSTHILGKWHLGFCNEKYLPTRRGFDSHHGFWGPYQDYYTKMTKMWDVKGRPNGYDYRDNDEIDLSGDGKFALDTINEKADRLFASAKANGTNEPFFLYIAYQAPHSPLNAPAKFQRLYSRHTHVSQTRRLYSAVVSALDESIGRIKKSLKDHGLYDNTVLVFSSDNGGEIKEGGNNLPLRGEKASVWEGGVRSPAFIRIPDKYKGRARPAPHHYDGMVHITDWMPTLLRAAGASGDAVAKMETDGVDQWDVLRGATCSNRGAQPGVSSQCTAPHMRRKMVLNLNYDQHNRATGAYREGNFKIVVNPNQAKGGWYPVQVKDDEEEEDGDGVGRARHQFAEEDTEKENIFFGYDVHMFNIKKDPAERHDLAKRYPKIAKYLANKFFDLQKDLVPNDNPRVKDAGLEKGFFVTGWC